MTRNGSNQNGEALPVLSPPRLAYHPAIQERFGIDKSDWKALVEAIFPSAQNPESVILALSYCKARKLDPFKRCVHIVPIWDSKKRQYVDTIWPGIGELRTTAHRTKVYAGRDATEFGPSTTHTWEGEEEVWEGEKGNRRKFSRPYKVAVEFPEWAQVTVYRMVGKERVAYAGPRVFWLETYGETKAGYPNTMWQRRPRGQIDKCAEAASLRAAFPEEVGNDYIDAEAHLTRQVESQVVEKAGIEGLKGRLAARTEPNEQTQPEPENEGEPENDTPPPPDYEDERDAHTEARAEEEKAKLAAAPVAQTAGDGSPDGSSNLF